MHGNSANKMPILHACINWELCYFHAVWLYWNMPTHLVFQPGLGDLVVLLLVVLDT